MNVMENIRKTMGWCPQKDFTREIISTEDRGLFFGLYFEKGASSGKAMEIIADIDIGVIPAAGLVAFLVLLFLGLIFPVLVYFAVLSVFLSYVIQFIQDRTTMEFAPSAIILRRPLFKPVIIPKESILKTEVVKNINYTLRWILLPLAIFVIIMLVSGVKDILYLSSSLKDFSVIISKFSLKGTVILIFVVTLYQFYIRTKYPKALKIASKNKKKITVYVENPKELESKLGGAQ